MVAGNQKAGSQAARLARREQADRPCPASRRPVPTAWQGSALLARPCLRRSVPVPPGARASLHPSPCATATLPLPPRNARLGSRPRTFVGKLSQRTVPHGRQVSGHPAAHHVGAAPCVRKVGGAAEQRMLRLVPAAAAGRRARWAPSRPAESACRARRCVTVHTHVPPGRATGRVCLWAGKSVPGAMEDPIPALSAHACAPSVYSQQGVKARHPSRAARTRWPRDRLTSATLGSSRCHPF